MGLNLFEGLRATTAQVRVRDFTAFTLDWTLDLKVSGANAVINV